MTKNNFKYKNIKHEKELDILIDFAKQEGLDLQFYNKEDFDNKRFKKPFNKYAHICEFKVAPKAVSIKILFGSNSKLFCFLDELK